jgi:hypothetical protein
MGVKVGKMFGVSRQSIYDMFARRGFKLRVKKLLPIVYFNNIKFGKGFEKGFNKSFNFSAFCELFCIFYKNIFIEKFLLKFPGFFKVN